MQGAWNCTGVHPDRGRGTGARPFDTRSPSSPKTANRVRGAHPSRRLSVLQRFALADLIGLGASLDEHFTAEQLRSAFRTLAHRYHPDRHAHRSEAEQAELAVMFRRLHDAYTLLARS